MLSVLNLVFNNINLNQSHEVINFKVIIIIVVRQSTDREPPDLEFILSTNKMQPINQLLLFNNKLILYNDYYNQVIKFYLDYF
jgi:hypothetical protein